MAKNPFKAFNAAIASKGISLEYHHMESFIEDENFKKEVIGKISKLEEYMSDPAVGVYAAHMTINIDDSYNCILTFSPAALLEPITRMLELSSDDIKNLSDYTSQIKKLRSIQTEEELEREFPFLYKNKYRVSRQEFLSNKDRAEYIIKTYEDERDRSTLSEFEKFKKMFRESKGYDIETLYNFSCTYQNFKSYRNRTVRYLESIVGTEDKPGRIKEISAWMKRNPINLKINNRDQKKLLIYVMNQNIRLIKKYIKDESYVDAQRNFTILEEMIAVYRNTYPNDKTKIEYTISDTGNLFHGAEEWIICDLKSLITDYNKLLEGHSFLKEGIKLPEIDKAISLKENMEKIDSYINDILNKTINEDKEHGAKDATEAVHKRIEELKTEIESKDISFEDRKEKALILKKIRMVVDDIKPKAIQTGTGKVFRNYYVYYYPNGMVAVDRIDGYGALYIMPVHIYNIARYKNNLTEVKNIPGVKSVNHKNKDWLNIAKDYIENGTVGLTEVDIKKSEEVASTDFPYSIEKLEELEKRFAEEANDQGVEETKRRIKKTKELTEIDENLKTNEFDKYEIYPVESRQIVEKFDGEKEDAIDSEEIAEIASSDKSFEELYAYWKNNHKEERTKRNPVVAGITKRRSMNENGRYCCEWCGADYSNTSPLRSHHVRPLSQGGPDNIYNTVCICPNCHDYVHSHEITDEEQNRLFEIVRKHIEDENPEYLPAFYDMMSPIAKDDEDYVKNKENIDRNFELQWNDVNIKKR